MPKCCLKSCSSKYGKKGPPISFHKLPKNKTRKTKWMEILGHEDIDTSPKNVFVCSLHFEECYMNKTLDKVQLKDNAIPTKFPKMSQQDLEQSATQNKLSIMEQLDIKVEPETHNDDTPHVHNMQQPDTFLTCNKKIKYESMLHHELIIKDDPDSDNECSEPIDDTQVMCAKTASGLSLLPVPLKVEVEDSVDRLEVSSIPSLCKQQVVPRGVSADYVCFSGTRNSDCTRTVSVKEHAKCTASGNTYQCGVCDKYFSYKGSLKYHSPNHPGAKPYKCNMCGRTFTHSCYLKYHFRVHTGEKPYKCNMCNRGFSRSTHLEIHIRTHTGEKPYKCKICDKRFNQLRSLVHHNRKHTGKH